jgi:alpha-L-rhamnosidase
VRNARQSAYRITAASSQEYLGDGIADIWDSGRVETDRCFDIRYDGRALQSRERVWWHVQVWDEAGGISPPSTASWFELGLLNAVDWKAEWISIEDSDEIRNRKVGLHWIWGQVRLDPRPQKFRVVYWLGENGLSATEWNNGPRPNWRPSEAEILLSAKDKLLGVWVNGTLITLPPSVHWGTMSRLSVNLIGGRNVICVEAQATTVDLAPAPDGGALAAMIKVKDADGHIRCYTSNPQWRTSNGESSDWIDAAFDDSNWASAVNLNADIKCEPWPPRPAMLLRREFSIAKPISRARLYITALGAYEAHINGRRVGDAHLSPEITVASNHVLYQCFDTKELLGSGMNVIGMVVGDGWYASALGWRNERNSLRDGSRRAFAQLVLDYDDGSTEYVSTDPMWRMTESAIRSSEIYNGESYDARAELSGWDRFGFDDRGWRAVDVDDPPDIRLVAQVSPPIREVRTLSVQKINEPHSGVFICDFGQNFSGWCRLHVKGAAGLTVRLRHAELLKASGDIDTGNLGGAAATDAYTLRGDPSGETFEPHFTYHGFRYVEVTGFPGRPTADCLIGIVVHSDIAETGAFEANNELVQHLWSNALWSQRSNFFGIPTDCPQRDERLGWMGDIQVFSEAAAFNMDINAFIRRFMVEVRASQSSDGAFPVMCPQPRSFGDLVAAGWSEAGVILPWTLYNRYGETSVIEENWDAMERWFNYVAEANSDFIWRRRRGIDLGDWLSVDAKSSSDETTPYSLIATSYWAYCTKLMGEMANAIGRELDVKRYAKLRSNIGQAFARQFITRNGTVGNASQTSYVLALKFDLVPKELRTAAGDHLTTDILRRGVKLSTGFLGTPYILDVLADTGHADIAVSLLLQTGYPSWGYMVEKGATTMWERWNADIDDGNDRSQNHYAFGAIAGFMYRRLAGISPVAPGFRRIDVHPIFDQRINWIRGSYESCLGRISTEVSGDKYGLSRLIVEIPPNAVAQVHLPHRPGSWLENRRPLDNRREMRLLAQSAAEFTIEVGSGSYQFSV